MHTTTFVCRFERVCVLATCALVGVGCERWEGGQTAQAQSARLDATTTGASRPAKSPPDPEERATPRSVRQIPPPGPASRPGKKTRRAPGSHVVCLSQEGQPRPGKNVEVEDALGPQGFSQVVALGEMIVGLRPYIDRHALLAPSFVLKTNAFERLKADWEARGGDVTLEQPGTHMLDDTLTRPIIAIYGVEPTRVRAVFSLCDVPDYKGPRLGLGVKRTPPVPLHEED